LKADAFKGGGMLRLATRFKLTARKAVKFLFSS